jgi:predicted amidophosphoribosyltransferase
MTTETGLTFPDLEFPPPPCPFCGEDLDYDRNWSCHTCNLTWDQHGRECERLYGERAQCPTVVELLSQFEDVNRDVKVLSETYRCVRDEDHDRVHRGVRTDRETGGTHEW